MIEDYLTAFESSLVGTADEKAEWVAELRAHLQEAEAAGAFAATLDSLGSPQEAAAAFRSGRPLRGADKRRRVQAALIDHVPLGIVTAATVLSNIASGRNSTWLTIPPVFGVVITDHVSILRTFLVPLTILWSGVGLALIEARTGRTPGKALLGLRTISDDGTALTLNQALRRRISIFCGPLIWLDWAFAAEDGLLARLGLHIDAGRHQRLFDLLAHTMVIEDPAPTRVPLRARPRHRTIKKGRP